MAFEVKIKNVENGYIMTRYDDETPIISVYSFDDDENDDSENNRMVMLRLLYAVIEYFGEYGSKHDAYRVRVNVEKQ